MALELAEHLARWNAITASAEGRSSGAISCEGTWDAFLPYCVNKNYGVHRRILLP